MATPKVSFTIQPHWQCPRISVDIQPHTAMSQSAKRQPPSSESSEAKRQKRTASEGEDEDAQDDPTTDAGGSQLTCEGRTAEKCDDTDVSGSTAAGSVSLEAEPTQETQRSKRTGKWECPRYVVRESDNALFVSIRQVCTWMSPSMCSKAFPAEAKTRAAQAGVEVPVHIVLLEYCPKRHRQEVHAYIAEMRATQEPRSTSAAMNLPSTAPTMCTGTSTPA